MLVSTASFGMMRQIIRDEDGFRVFDGKQEREVRPCFVDPLLRRMNTEQLKKFVEQGNRIRVIRLSDGEHRLHAMVPGKGGGPVLAILAGWAVRFAMYTPATVAGASVIAVTGPVGIGAAAVAATGYLGTVESLALLASAAALVVPGI
jgi:uncharacterized membrane protein (Fun14 family)